MPRKKDDSALSPEEQEKRETRRAQIRKSVARNKKRKALLKAGKEVPDHLQILTPAGIPLNLDPTPKQRARRTQKKDAEARRRESLRKSRQGGEAGPSRDSSEPDESQDEQDFAQLAEFEATVDAQVQSWAPYGQQPQTGPGSYGYVPEQQEYNPYELLGSGPGPSGWWEPDEPGYDFYGLPERGPSGQQQHGNTDERRAAEFARAQHKALQRKQARAREDAGHGYDYGL